MEDQIRLAAFRWLEQQTGIYGDVLPYSLLNHGFYFQGERITLIGQRGIWKPKQFAQIPISITTSVNGPYDDHSDENGFIIYKYRGENPLNWDNVGLREAMLQRIPLIYFHGISTGKYFACWPVFVIYDNPSSLSFTIAFDDTSIAKLHSANDIDSTFTIGDKLVKDETFYRRQYTTSIVKSRLHQSAFRIRVLEAYDEQCAFCRLKHPELLDAAHIIPDTDPRGIPSVTNGLSLCKIHHAAFDRNIIGETPDYQIMVKKEILEEKDGPMLKHGIQQLHQQKIKLPRSRNLWPDQEKLEERYYRFTKAL